MRLLGRFRRSGRVPEDVLERELLVPTPDTGQQPGVEVLEKDRVVSFVTVLDDDGLSILPAFTSEQALSRWKPEGSTYIALQGSVLVEMLAGSDFHRMVVDGADPTAFAITRSAARSLTGAVAPPLPAGSTVRIGLPAQEPPKGLVEALAGACRREAAIREAYLYQFQVVEREEPPQLAVGLLVCSSSPQVELRRIAASIGHEVNPQAWGYESFDYHLLEGDLLALVRSSEHVVLLPREE